MRSLARRLVIFTTLMAGIGSLEATAAYCLAGFPGVEGVGFSVILCSAPGWLMIVVGERMRQAGAAVYTVLVGVGFRVVFVLGGMFAVGVLRHDLGVLEFTVWLIANYLVAFALETWLVILPSLDESK